MSTLNICPKSSSYSVVDDGSIHPAVVGDIQNLFETLTQEKLSEVEELIRKSIQNSEMIDEEFWLALLKRLGYFHAKARIDEEHKVMVEERIEDLQDIGIILVLEHSVQTTAST